MDIPSLLAQNQLYRLDEPVPSDESILVVERQLGRELPGQYKTFVRLGGLNDLRFGCEVLAPSEIENNQGYVSASGYVPFASNGCGDLYCWPADALDNPIVLLWEHDTGAFIDCGTSFLEWLAGQRF
jgi:hypothetical protein